MLETVNLSASLDKEEYRSLQEALDLRLGRMQRGLREAGVPVLVVVEGWDAAGKGSTLGRLLQPLDPRGFKVHHVGPATPLEGMFPPMWRFWNLLPARGALAVYNHSWYRRVWNEPLEGGADLGTVRAAYEEIRVFERQLADAGAVIVKFFLHIGRDEQARRFKALKKDPAFAWKVGPAEKERHKRYDKYLSLAEDMLRETSTPFAPWTMVAATDERHRNTRVAETLAAALENALERPAPPRASAPALPPRRSGPLDRVNPDQSLDREVYAKRLPKLQQELRRLQHLCYLRRRPVVMAFEGWDAAGKGGAIKRLTRELDPRGYEVIPVAAPDGVEKTHHHLWRFWRSLPKAGHFTVFDRTWYGRVLVERVEGYARPEEWQRAYREINEFEAELVEAGMVVLKFWLHISRDEQLRRFEARQEDPEKQWKITEEDWRNREKWDAYEAAVSAMIEQTSSAQAPWTLIEGNDKRHARMQVLQTAVDRIAAALGE
ncbi:MAG: polyphosphate:AMP phosphotransferase [Candidatus Hydrogenedentes bacterium]|nr:polyphosphate:AMP phosphotransferase [Candidatus Hydrogenedentota bacterium]